MLLQEQSVTDGLLNIWKILIYNREYLKNIDLPLRAESATTAPTLEVLALAGNLKIPFDEFAGHLKIPFDRF